MTVIEFCSSVEGDETEQRPRAEGTEASTETKQKDFRKPKDKKKETIRLQYQKPQSSSAISIKYVSALNL